MCFYVIYSAKKGKKIVTEDKELYAPYGYDETKDFITYSKPEVLELVDPASSITENGKKILVYLPDRYSEDKKYPVLYLLNDDKNNWNDLSGQQIFTNAMAFKQANRMIVVMTPYDKTEGFVKGFADSIMPAVENRYSVATGSDNTAVAGCDAAGDVALRIGTELSDKIAHVGVFAPEEDYKINLYSFICRLFKRGTNDEGISNGFVASLDVIPTDNFPNLNKPGRNEVVYYDTYTYDEGNSLPMHKYANVYVPYGYDPDKPYNILYLMHGGGENAETWIVGDNRYGDYTHNQDMVNFLFASGFCEPCIIVTPTFYRTDDVPMPENHRDLTKIFRHELRNDLIPAIEAKYHTYADFDISEESLTGSRMHRAFAGFSMGSGTTYASAFYGNYDMFAWFAPYSGVFVDEDQYDAETDRFIKVIEDGAANGMPLGFFYSGNGTKDWVRDAQYAIMYRALAKSDYLIAGRNFDFVMIPEAEHNMWQWHVHLYNTLKVFFKEV